MAKDTRKKSRHKKRRRSKAPLFLLLFILLIAAAAGGFIYYQRFMPTSERMSLNAYYEPAREDEAVIILNQTYMETPDEDSAPYGLYENGTYYLRLDFVKSNLDDRYVYDSDAGILRYTTYTEMTTAHADSADITVTTYEGSAQNDASESLDAPAVISETDAASDSSYAYISLPFLQRFTDITCYMAEADASADAPYRLVIYTAGFETTGAKVSSDTQLRRFGGPKSKILADVASGTEVTVAENYGSWSLVVTQDGVLGCIKNGKLSAESAYTVANTMETAEPTHNLLDERVNLVWHQSLSPTSNEAGPELISQTDGVNVVCPTWFTIEDNSGALWTNTSEDYVSYCHNKGMQVWGLVNNLERGDIDSAAVLNSAASRDRLISNLIDAAVSADLDGINVDFEALPIEAKNGYIEFVRELSLQCKARGLILSVDNYAPLDNNLFYNRTEEGLYADYVIIVAYDEHYGGQDEAGSGSSLDYVTQAVIDTLDEVSNEQVILGLPFYTRIWSGEDGEDLTSSTISMANTADYISSHGVDLVWDETEGQYVGDFTIDGVRTRIWVEDENSLTGKLELMNEYDLAGCAFWKLGFETASTWTAIEKCM